MPPWIDPNETDPATWDRASDQDGASRTVYERAHATSIPYERYDDLTLFGPDVAAEYETSDYDHARLHYHIVVDGDGRLKLLTKGHLWGDDESHQRFRIQYRRPPEPTDIPPFETYIAWARFDTGSVRRRDGTIEFESDDTEPRERTLELSWPEMYSSDQLRIAEAELVRNPPLARYALSSLDLWADVRDVLRYNPDAFARKP